MSAPFRPSRNGFRFANRFAPPMTGALPSAWRGRLPAIGLCGGMAGCARDAFARGEALPAQATPPPPGTRLYGRLWRRQVATFGPPPLFPVVWRFARWTRRTDAALARSTRREHARARHRLASGSLVTLGLVYVRRLTRLWENHQVLAYAEARGGALRVYDPNEPRRDDVALRPSPHPGGPAFHTCVGEERARPVRGFFVMEGPA